MGLSVYGTRAYLLKKKVTQMLQMDMIMLIRICISVSLTQVKLISRGLRQLSFYYHILFLFFPSSSSLLLVDSIQRKNKKWKNKKYLDGKSICKRWFKNRSTQTTFSVFHFSLQKDYHKINFHNNNKQATRKEKSNFFVWNILYVLCSMYVMCIIFAKAVQRNRLSTWKQQP